jgi:hypothetical protein
MYNQVANYVLMQQEINIAIGAKSPEVYFKELREQCQGGKRKNGGIGTIEVLEQNLKVHCIPESIFEMNVHTYDELLEERRRLMSFRMKEYYKSL